MPSPSIDIPEAFEAAVKAGQQVRRERLLRGVRNRSLRTGVVIGLAVGTVVLAFAAFVAGDREAAILIGVMASLTTGAACAGWSAGRKKAEDLLRELDRPT